MLTLRQTRVYLARLSILNNRIYKAWGKVGSVAESVAWLQLLYLCCVDQLSYTQPGLPLTSLCQLCIYLLRGIFLLNELQASSCGGSDSVDFASSRD